jgi:hypothetical protein
MVIKVALGFARLSDAELDNFSQGVINALTGNATYPTPPVTLENMQTARDDFTAKVAVARTGGQADTAAKNNSRQTLVGMIRQTASYVQMRCDNDLQLLLSSGFQAQSTSRASVQLEKPQGLGVKHGVSGQLIVRVERVPNTNMYEGRAKLEGGDWLPSVFTGDSQHIIFNGLSPGKSYVIQIRSLGGATGQSDWSDPVMSISI